MIRKETYLNDNCLTELRRIIESSEILKEDDQVIAIILMSVIISIAHLTHCIQLWPEPDEVGRQVLVVNTTATSAATTAPDTSTDITLQHTLRLLSFSIPLFFHLPPPPLPLPLTSPDLFCVHLSRRFLLLTRRALSLFPTGAGSGHGRSPYQLLHSQGFHRIFVVCSISFCPSFSHTIFCENDPVQIGTMAEVEACKDANGPPPPPSPLPTPHSFPFHFSSSPALPPQPLVSPHILFPLNQASAPSTTSCKTSSALSSQPLPSTFVLVSQPHLYLLVRGLPHSHLCQINPL
jgi:hypothetical protein